jgi:hypothetical protein
MIPLKEQFPGIRFASLLCSTVRQTDTHPSSCIKNWKGSFTDLTTLSGPAYIRWQDRKISFLDNTTDFTHINARIRLIVILFSSKISDQRQLSGLLDSEDSSGQTLFASLLKSDHGSLYTLLYEQLRKSSVFYTDVLPIICSRVIAHGANSRLLKTLDLMIQSAHKLTRSHLVANIEFMTAVLASNLHDQIHPQFPFYLFLIPLIQEALKISQVMKSYLNLIYQLIARGRVLEVNSILKLANVEHGTTLFHRMPYHSDLSIYTDFINLCSQNESIRPTLVWLIAKRNLAGRHFLEEALRNSFFDFFRFCLKHLLDNSHFNLTTKEALLYKPTSINRSLFYPYVQRRPEEALGFLDSLPMSSLELLTVLKVGRLTGHSLLSVGGVAIDPDFYDILDLLSISDIGMDQRLTGVFLTQLCAFDQPIFKFLFDRYIKEFYEKNLIFNCLDRDVLSSFIFDLALNDTLFALDGLEYLIKTSDADPMITFNKSFDSKKASRFLLVIFEDIKAGACLQSRLEDKVFHLIQTLCSSKANAQSIYQIISSIFQEYPDLVTDLKELKLKNVNLRLCLIHFTKNQFAQFYALVSGSLAMFHRLRLMG